ncbi:MAG: hypothetical protein ACQGVK_15235 [Myxococcota bacterium]
MIVTFFTALRDEASGVGRVDDLPDGPLGEPLSLDSAAPLRALASLLAGEGQGAGAGPLRDATCQSFPVWEFASPVTRALAGCSDAALEAVAERWLEPLRSGGGDVDLYEVESLLRDLHEAARDLDGEGAQLFALLEERAF